MLHRPALATLLSAALLVGCGGPSTVAENDPAPPAPAPVAVTPSALPPSSVPPAPAPESSVGDQGTVPDVTGHRLSDAETELRAAGFLAVRAVDATGRGRTILGRSNWIVVRQRPAAGSPVVAGTDVTLAVTKPTNEESRPPAEKEVVPAVVCLNLQDAQDALRSAGFYVLIAEDGLGRRRYPVLDRNWIVVGQSAEPGTSPEPTATIQLTVVKYGEPTGNSGCKS